MSPEPTMTEDRAISQPPVPPTTPGSGEILLRADRISRRFGGLIAVRDVDLEIPRGGIISIIGPNGAGKTTFFNVVAGIIDPTSGTVSFRDRLLITRPSRLWLESILWVVPSLVAVLVAFLLGAIGNETGIAITGATAISLLVIVLVTALARPPLLPAPGRPAGRDPERAPQRRRGLRDRPDLPEHPPVPEHDCARERARGDASPAELQPHRPFRVNAAPEPRGGGGSTEGP
jgi:energy-coupling factor transporter ATP-binding protein EcfA2